MFKVLKKNSIAGKEVNEDMIFAKENYIIFLDGASGLIKNSVSKKSDALWYVNKFTSYFDQLYSISNNPASSIKKAIDKINEDFRAMFPASRDLGLLEPTASGVVMVDRDKHINLYYFGDVKTYIIYKSKKIDVFYDEALTKLDQKVFDEAKKISESRNISFKQAINELDEMVKNNRLMKNSEEGYYIFGLNKLAIENINKKYNLDKSKISQILVMSDGFYGVFSDYKPQELLDFVNKSSKDIVFNIKELYLNDENFEKYNRFKLVDDISFALLEVK